MAARLAALLCASLIACGGPRPSVVDVVSDAPDAADVVTDTVQPACVDGGHAAYPAGPFALYPGSTLPDLNFAGADGAPVPLHAQYAPCSPARVLVLRVLAAWSGPARWQIAHTGRLRARPDAARITVMDLLVLGQDDQPATTEDLGDLRAGYDTPPDVLAADPAYEWRSLFVAGGGLPIVAMVDTSTMRVLALESTVPSAAALDADLTRAIARLDGTDAGAPPQPALHDGLFSDDQWDLIRAMTLPASPPPDPTNAHADDPAAAALGRAFFTDGRFSIDGGVPCSHCHAPDRAFVDGRATAVGEGWGNRNTPSVLFAPWSRWQFWDGRADSPWMQATGPVENPDEMGSTRLALAHVVADQYRAAYEAVFGALPALSDTARFPLAGRPMDGSGAWEAMTAADQQAVDRVFANFGKALEAYERSLRTRPSALDRYAMGDATALNPVQRQGLLHFVGDAGCVQCHWGPVLSDQSFHNTLTPTGRNDGTADVGRWAAVAMLQASPFRSDGPFSDAPHAYPPLDPLTATDSMRGQFRTPSLRAIAATGPWGHGGTFATLPDLLSHYARLGAMPTVDGTTGTEDAHLVSFHTDAGYLDSLVQLMTAMTADPLQ